MEPQAEPGQAAKHEGKDYGAALAPTLSKRQYTC